MKFNFDNSLNKGSKFNFRFDDNVKYEYVTLEELYNEDENAIRIVELLYTNTKSKYGEHELLVTGNRIVNLPKHLNTVVAEMKDSPEMVEKINNGKLGFKVDPYEYAQNKTAYSVIWGLAE